MPDKFGRIIARDFLWIGHIGYHKIQRLNMSPTAIPSAVCSIVGDVIGAHHYRHQKLETLFYEAGATGEVPPGNCISKCQEWLKDMHRRVPDPYVVLGRILIEFMEVDCAFDNGSQMAGRKRIHDVLARYGLSYRTGGQIIGGTVGLPTRSLRELIRNRDLAEVNKEFDRALTNVEADPGASITAACSILEALFKVYIDDSRLETPADQSLKPLWKTVSKHLGLDPGAVEDDDVKKVLSGMNSIVDGVGSLRTHTGSAHGHGRRSYRLEGRHARLSVHAAHTLAGFILETWDARNRKARLRQ